MPGHAQLRRSAGPFEPLAGGRLRGHEAGTMSQCHVKSKLVWKYDILRYIEINIYFISIRYIQYIINGIVMKYRQIMMFNICRYIHELVTDMLISNGNHGLLWVMLAAKSKHTPSRTVMRVRMKKLCWVMMWPGDFFHKLQLCHGMYLLNPLEPFRHWLL